MPPLFLEQNPSAKLDAMSVAPAIKTHVLDVISKGYTVIEGALPQELCRDTIAAFRRFEKANEAIFSEYRDADGHYPRIVNLHLAMRSLLHLFARNTVWL